MAILVLATSGRGGEIGLEGPGGAFRTRALGTGAARGRLVLAVVAELFRETGVPRGALEWVAVDVGPGSFTGVRVGVTAAKAIAWALSTGVVGVPSLAALAHGAPDDREVVAVRDAGRGRLYWARYGRRERGVRPLLEGPGRDGSTDVLSALAGTLLVGEDAPALLRGLGVRADALATEAGAQAVLAEARAAVGAGHSPLGPHGVVPLYLQPSAPERRRSGEIDGEALDRP